MGCPVLVLAQYMRVYLSGDLIKFHPLNMRIEESRDTHSLGNLSNLNYTTREIVLNGPHPLAD